VPNAPLGYNTPSACKLHGGERALRPHAAAIAYPSSDPQTAAPFDSQQCFSLTTNQPPATSRQYSSLEQTSTSHQPPANRTGCGLGGTTTTTTSRDTEEVGGPRPSSPSTPRKTAPPAARRRRVASARLARTHAAAVASERTKCWC
jgi:hypothetical protein